MRITAVLFLSFLLGCLYAKPSQAVSRGQIIEFEGGDAGKVIFVGKTHADRGLMCRDCHPKIFPMKTPGAKESAKITLESHKSGYCFICHDGNKVFAASGNCSRCHEGAVNKPLTK